MIPAHQIVKGNVRCVGSTRGVLNTALAAAAAYRAILSSYSDPNVTDPTKALDSTQPTATRLVERLVAARVIRQTRTEGRSVFYRPIGEALVAFGAAPPT